MVSHVDPHLRSPTLWLRRCGFCRVSLAICIRPSNKCNPLNDSEKLNLNELDHCLSGSNLTKFYLFEGAIDVRGRSYIYILTISMYTVTPEKMEVQPWVEKHSLIGMHLSLAGSTLTHCDFKYLCPFRRTHVSHPIGFLETSKHKYLKHPKTKANKNCSWAYRFLHVHRLLFGGFNPSQQHSSSGDHCVVIFPLLVATNM